MDDPTPAAAASRLGLFLRERRERLDPAAFGFVAARRRTPGLRREEVAQLAHISPTWYTWLEQGRGGAPSPAVLERIARALRLTDLECERLFLLALGRPPEARFRQTDTIRPRLQRILDALDPTPALIRSATWDVLAWNRAATVMTVDYGALPPAQRNVLRFLFLDPRARAAQADWATVARLVVNAFRLETARAGASLAVRPLVEELCAASPEFAAMWHEDGDPPSPEHQDGVKHIHHPVAGALAFEYSAFAVDGRADLSLVVYNPAGPEDAARIRALLAARAAKTPA